MTRAELVSSLAAHIISENRFRIAIDGRSAAGKSSLAADLAASIAGNGRNCTVLSMDSFHHPRERRYTRGPFSPEGYYQDAFDHEAATAAVRAAGSSLIVFEGIFAFRRELDFLWDFRILVSIDRNTSLVRALRRDAGQIGDAETVRRKYELRYDPAWMIHEDCGDLKAKADVVIDNANPSAPAVTFRRLKASIG